MLERQTKAFLLSIVLHLALAMGMYWLLSHQPVNLSESATTLKLTDFALAKQMPPSRPSAASVRMPRPVAASPVRTVRRRGVVPVARHAIDANATTARPRPVPLPVLPSVSSPAVARKPSRFLDALNDTYAGGESNPVQELYGDDFKALSKEQKDFIRNNLDGIGKVTQEYLYKTSLDIIRSMEGTAVVEFDLKPNGDIENLRIRTSSSYSMLDKHAIRTIENAYKDYPHPSVTTPVRIYVHYTITR